LKIQLYENTLVPWATNNEKITFIITVTQRVLKPVCCQALGVTKFENMRAMILVTLCFATILDLNVQKKRQWRVQLCQRLLEFSSLHFPDM